MPFDHFTRKIIVNRQSSIMLMQGDLLSDCQKPITSHDWWCKGWDLKRGLIPFYPLFVQSELSLVKYVQKSKVRTVLKSQDLSFFKNVLTFDIWPCFTRDNQIGHTKDKKKTSHPLYCPFTMIFWNLPDRLNHIMEFCNWTKRPLYKFCVLTNQHFLNKTFT